MTANIDPRLKRWRALSYIQAIFGLEIFIAPVLIIFYTKYAGYSFAQYGKFLSLLFLFGWLFQIPTGAFADRIGRKFSLITGNCIYLTGMILLSVLGANMPLLLLTILLSLGSALSSATFQSMMFDAFSEKKAEEQFHHVNATSGSIALFSSAVAGIIGALLANISLVIPMVLDCVVLSIITLILFFRLQEQKIDTASSGSFKESFISIVDTIKKGFSITFNTPALILVTVISAVLFGCIRTSFNFYQPMLEYVYQDLRIYGIVHACIVSISAISAYCMSKSNQAFINTGKPLLAMIAILCCSTALSWIMRDTPTVLFLALTLIGHQIVRGMYPSYCSYRTNLMIPDNTSSRTTILSFSALLRAVFAACLAYSSGMVADHYGDIQAFSFIGCISVTILLIASWQLWRVTACHRPISR